MIDLAVYETAAQNSEHTLMTTHTTSSTSNDGAPQSQSAISVYQQLGGHLATSKLDVAAEALPSVLKSAGKQEWTMTQTLEHLLSCGRAGFDCAGRPAHGVVMLTQLQ